MLTSVAMAVFGGRQIIVGIIKFLSTPLGQIVAVIGALVLTAVVTDAHARIRDHRVCNARVERLNGEWQQRELQAKAAYDQARNARDQQVGNAVKLMVAGEIKNLSELNDRLQLQVKAHEASTPATPQCRVSPGLVDRRNRMLGDRKK